MRADVERHEFGAPSFGIEIVVGLTDIHPYDNMAEFEWQYESLGISTINRWVQ